MALVVNRLLDSRDVWNRPKTVVPGQRTDLYNARASDVNPNKPKMTNASTGTVRRFPSVQNRVLMSARRGSHRPDEGLQLLYCPLPRPIAHTEHSSKARSS